MLNSKDVQKEQSTKTSLRSHKLSDPTLPTNPTLSDEVSDLTLPRARQEPNTRAALSGDFARRTPAARNYIVWDQELIGFGLRIRASGTKSWIVQYRRRGKELKVTLGKANELSAKEARARGRALLAEAAQDGLMKPVRRTAAAPTFAGYAPAFWHDYARHWKASTCKRNRHALEHDLIPVFGARPIDQICRADVLRWRDDLAARPGVFNRAIPLLSVMLGHSEQVGLRPRGSNPARGTPRYKVQLRERYLRRHEHRALWAVLNDAEAEFAQAVSIIRLLLLTGARKSEITTLQWEFVQPPRLKLPDSKTGPKTIMLNSYAAAILAQIAPVEGTPFVFPDKNGKGPLRALPRQWEVLRQRAAIEDVRLHDLRHSFASAAINANIALPLIGGLLGHALPETTQRYAHLADVTVAEAAGRVCATLAGHLGGVK